MSDGGCCRIPTLHKKCGDNEILHTYTTDDEKADAFASIFFLPKLLSLPDTPDNAVPDPSPLPFHLPHIHQIICRIDKTSAHKAPGNDGIPNIVLKRCVPLIAPILLTCLHAILRLQYFPQWWREWTTVVIRKPGREDYTIPKAYQPIALYCTMGKIISGVMTDVMVHITVRHSLLPSKHFGGLPGKTTTDSLLYLVHRIKAAWRKRKVVTMVFLDIANAFPNVVTECLLRNMQRLGYPSEIVSFFKALLTDHSTRLKFDDFISAIIHIDNGIGQGEPGSMILYLIYSADLVLIPQGLDEDGGAYVDDNFILAIGDTYEDCDTKINRMMDKQELWALSHNSQAEISKYQCL